MSDTLQRYNVVTVRPDDGRGAYGSTVASAAGDWVRYEDAARDLAASQARVERLEKELRKLDAEFETKNRRSIAARLVEIRGWQRCVRAALAEDTK